MKLEFERETEFKKFIIELKKRMSGKEAPKIEVDDLTRSAVMLLLMNKDNNAHVLLTKRSMKVETHKGHMSLPGGAFDNDDKNLLETALRETNEEVGIKPGDIEIIGELGDFLTISGFHVNAFVGAINYPCKYDVNFDEIAECVEVPLSIFVNREYDRIEQMRYKGVDLEVYYYYHKGFEIWGLTARILTEFAENMLMD